MWEQTLKQINPLVTPYKAANLWQADADSLKLVSDGINLVYRFNALGQGRYLRITHPLLRSQLELQSAIDFQCYLYEQDVPVCQPIKSSLGNYIEVIRQAEQTYFAQVFAEVPGKIMHFNFAKPKPYEIWGQALAKLHQAAKYYQPKPHLQFKTWQNLWAEITAYMPISAEFIRSEYQAIDIWLKTLSLDTAHYGLTHADHRLDNILYDGRKIYIIDFDEPVYHWFSSDIARPFLNLCEQDFTKWQVKFEAFLTGYNSILVLSQAQVESIPWHIRMKNLDIYLWTKHHWHNPIAPGGGSTKRWLNQLEKLILNPVTRLNL